MTFCTVLSTSRKLKDLWGIAFLLILLAVVSTTDTSSRNFLNNSADAGSTIDVIGSRSRTPLGPQGAVFSQPIVSPIDQAPMADPSWSVPGIWSYDFYFVNSEEEGSPIEAVTLPIGVVRFILVAQTPGFAEALTQIDAMLGSGLIVKVVNLVDR